MMEKELTNKNLSKKEDFYFQMRNFTLMNFLLILSILTIFPQAQQTAYANANLSKVTVIAANLHVREDASISSKILGLVHQGDTFEIKQEKNGWDQIIFSDNQTGWVNNRYVITAKNIEATVEANALNVREKPTVLSKTISQLNLGEKITVVYEYGKWAKAESASGIQGWVSTFYIKKSGEKQAVSDNSVAKVAAEQLAAADNPATANNEKQLNGKIIVLDPGHGGIDGGTKSIAGTSEKTLTLATAQAVKQKLLNAGATVILTRTTDDFVSLQQRPVVSKRSNADAFISFHYNWVNDPMVNGVLGFYYQQTKDNLLASSILNAVAKATGLNNDGTRFGNLEVLRNNSQPSTLIELGFLSNQQEDTIVESSGYRENVAQGVYQGLLDYFQSNKNK